MTSSSGHRSPRRARACAERTPVFDSRTMIPMAIRTSGKSRPRFRYIAGLSTPNQEQESERDQYRGPDEFPADVTEHAQVGQEEVGAKRNQDEADQHPWGRVPSRGPHPTGWGGGPAGGGAPAGSPLLGGGVPLVCEREKPVRKSCRISSPIARRRSPTLLVVAAGALCGGSI